MEETSDSKPASEALMVGFFRCSGSLIPCLMPAGVIEGGLQGALRRLKSHRHSIAGEWRNHARGISDGKGRSRLGPETESGDSTEAGGVDVRRLKAVGEFLKSSRSKVRDQQSRPFGFDFRMRVEEPASIYETLFDSGESEVSRGPHVHFQIVREIEIERMKLQAKPSS